MTTSTNIELEAAQTAFEDALPAHVGRLRRQRELQAELAKIDAEITGAEIPFLLTWARVVFVEFPTLQRFEWRAPHAQPDPEASGVFHLVHGRPEARISVNGRILQYIGEDEVLREAGDLLVDIAGDHPVPDGASHRVIERADDGTLTHRVFWPL